MAKKVKRATARKKRGGAARRPARGGRRTEK
jgi:hypothetical protein